MYTDKLSKTEGFEMLRALSGIYISIHYFDLKNDVIKAFKSNQFIDEWADEVEGIQDKVFNVMANITKEEHLKMMMEFVDFSTLPKRLNGKNDISIVFEGMINGWCRARFIVMEREGNSVSRALYVVESINEEKRREDYLLYLAGTDLMTGIDNRGNGESKIKDYLAENMQGVFCLFDLDEFKKINDTYGHDVGDKVLVAVADVLKKVKRERDVIMRLGGDEFAIFYVDETKEHLQYRMEQLFEEIDKIVVPPMDKHVTISLGATLAKPGMDFDTAYKLADEGVYKSKNMRDNSYHLTNKL